MQAVQSRRQVGIVGQSAIVPAQHHRVETIDGGQRRGHRQRRLRQVAHQIPALAQVERRGIADLDALNRQRAIHGHVYPVAVIRIHVLQATEHRQVRIVAQAWRAAVTVERQHPVVHAGHIGQHLRDGRVVREDVKADQVPSLVQVEGAHRRRRREAIDVHIARIAGIVPELHPQRVGVVVRCIEQAIIVVGKILSRRRSRRLGHRWPGWNSIVGSHVRQWDGQGCIPRPQGSQLVLLIPDDRRVVSRHRVQRRQRAAIEVRDALIRTPVAGNQIQLRSRHLELGVAIRQRVVLLRLPPTEIDRIEDLLQLAEELRLSGLGNDPDRHRRRQDHRPVNAGAVVIVPVWYGESLGIQRHDILCNGPRSIERRHHRDLVGIHTQHASQEVAFQLLRVLLVDEVHLGHRSADGNVLELGRVFRGGCAGVVLGPDGHHVVLMAVNEEALEVPGIASKQVVSHGAIVDG